MTDKICPKCGSDDTMMIADKLGKLFEKKSMMGIVAPDALTADIHWSTEGVPLVPFICDSCNIWFAIFTVPDEETK